MRPRDIERDHGSRAQSYTEGIGRRRVDSFVTNSYVSTLCPVVICPYLCTSEPAFGESARDGGRVYIYIYICIYTYTYTHIYTHIHICTYIYIYTCMYVYIHICVCIHIYI